VTQTGTNGVYYVKEKVNGIMQNMMVGFSLLMAVFIVMLAFLIKTWFDHLDGGLRKYSAETDTKIQSVKSYFMTLLEQRTGEVRCDRCGATAPRNYRLLGSVTLDMCTKCKNEWDSFIANVPECTEYRMVHAKVSGYENGAIPLNPNKFEEELRKEYRVEKQLNDKLRKIAVEWIQKMGGDTNKLGITCDVAGKDVEVVDVLTKTNE